MVGESDYPFYSAVQHGLSHQGSFRHKLLALQCQYPGLFSISNGVCGRIVDDNSDNTSVFELVKTIVDKVIANPACLKQPYNGADIYYIHKPFPVFHRSPQPDISYDLIVPGLQITNEQFLMGHVEHLRYYGYLYLQYAKQYEQLAIDYNVQLGHIPKIDKVIDRGNELLKTVVKAHNLISPDDIWETYDPAIEEAQQRSRASTEGASQGPKSPKSPKQMMPTDKTALNEVTQAPNPVHASYDGNPTGGGKRRQRRGGRQRNRQQPDKTPTMNKDVAQS